MADSAKMLRGKEDFLNKKIEEKFPDREALLLKKFFSVHRQKAPLSELIALLLTGNYSIDGSQYPLLHQFIPHGVG